MLRPVLTLAVAAAAAFPLSSASATPPPEGRPCSFNSVQQEDLTGEAWEGYLAGGPVAAPGSTITLRCSIHVGNADHAGPAAAEAAGEPRPDVAVVAARLTFTASPDDLVALCTEATVDATSWYWDDDAGAWTTDRATPCRVGEHTQVPPQELLDCISYGYCGELPEPVGTVVRIVYCIAFCFEPWICPVLQELADEDVPGVVDVEDDGDVRVAGEPFWDCPPYDDWDA